MENQYNTETQQTPEFPMKWHKFLIYFSLWAGAVISLINAATYFLGLHYGESVQMVYAVYPGLSILDKLMGIVCLGILVFTVMTRFALAGYQAKGPKMLMVVYALNAVMSIVYVLLASMVSGLPLGDLMGSDVIGSLIGSAAMIFINRDYYNKRAALFTR